MLVLAAHLPLTTIVMHLSLVIQERSSGKCVEKRKLRSCTGLGWLRCGQLQREKAREDFLDVF